MNFVNNFDKVADSYDDYASIQKQCAFDMTEFLDFPKKDILSVIDIGSGTGTSTIEVMKKFPKASYTLCDISEKMIEVSKNKLKNCVHMVCDAENYDFPENYDLCVSNLCMQWFNDIESFFQKMSGRVKYMAFTTLIDGSFKEFYNVFDNNLISKMKYKTFDELSVLCGRISKNFKCIEKNYDIECKNIIEATRHFKNIGANISDNKSKNIILPRETKVIKLNYKVFIGSLII